MSAIRTRLHGKAVLVTGAASGIGRATAHEVARRGGRLVLTDVQAAPLEQIASGLGDAVLHHAAADITDRAAVQSLAAAVHERHGTLDVVMNVAGISTWGAVERLTGDDWRAQIEVNLMGPIHVIEAFVGPMVTAGRGGHLVNVASAAALIGLPWHAAYSASKFGLRGISEVLRFDLEPAGIGVTLVCPGAVATPLVDSVRILGVDREHPAAKKMDAEFRRHAVTPEQAATAIADGVERGRTLVYTSRDIRVAHFLQRVAPPLYALAMRRLNRRMLAVAAAASSERA